eukprot:gene19491-biopygen6110
MSRSRGCGVKNCVHISGRHAKVVLNKNKFDGVDIELEVGEKGISVRPKRVVSLLAPAGVGTQWPASNPLVQLTSHTKAGYQAPGPKNRDTRDQLSATLFKRVDFTKINGKAHNCIN